MAAPVALDQIAARLGIDLVGEQVQLYDAAAIAAVDERVPWHRDLISADPARPALIIGVGPDNVRAVSRFVVEAWDTGAGLRLLDLDVDGTAGVVISDSELVGYVASGEEGARFALVVAAGDSYRSVRSAATLSRIMARLRAPGGCPWDREQTTVSQRTGVIDEAYEIVDAIDAGDDRNLAEELGDVLMAITLQAQIAADDGRFTLSDAYAAVNAKMVRRHPHVFGDTVVSGTDDIVANWARIKADEKAAAGTTPPTDDDPLHRYPTAMPATEVIDRLMRRGDLAPGSNHDDRDIAGRFVAWYVDRLSEREDPEGKLRDAIRAVIESKGGANAD